MVDGSWMERLPVSGSWAWARGRHKVQTAASADAMVHDRTNLTVLGLQRVGTFHLAGRESHYRERARGEGVHEIRAIGFEARFLWRHVARASSELTSLPASPVSTIVLVSDPTPDRPASLI